MKSENRERNLIGITMGDPGGIGPEVILKALSSQEMASSADFVIIGCYNVLRVVADSLSIGKKLQLSRFDSLPLNADRDSINNINVLDLENFSVQDAISHKPLPSSGRASVEYIMKGLDLAMGGEIDAIVTAPISKEAVKMAGFEFAGHTELLKEKTAAEDVVMLMAGNGLRVSFVTTHLAVRDVFRFINHESVFSTIQTTAKGLKNLFGIADPKIAVCGLNPHCGDGDHFGTEERDIIVPAINCAQEMGIDCIGPLSSDTVFNKALNGEFDVVVVQFHDQGTIPIKMHAFDSGVNITLGIPIIRTSPTHGTAFDIAGKCVADPGSMIEATKTAIMMTEKQKHSFV
ncbi:MAG: D-threonate 4-phosphate dehydrogenase [Candidatus Scalindua arabica]|uniref:D-threonate 4-phosphate dehydrogenase n=1 Tax=Candidatus Scalindua arabica TaxID=1127984 RepID=A0A941W371_9BACT|nr:D-threonate 4-phosphate dehydrogenase [Candidatus Scalindua arabica]